MIKILAFVGILSLVVVPLVGLILAEFEIIRSEIMSGVLVFISVLTAVAIIMALKEPLYPSEKEDDYRGGCDDQDQVTRSLSTVRDFN